MTDTTGETIIITTFLDSLAAKERQALCELVGQLSPEITNRLAGWLETLSDEIFGPVLEFGVADNPEDALPWLCRTGDRLAATIEILQPNADDRINPVPDTDDAIRCCRVPGKQNSSERHRSGCGGNAPSIFPDPPDTAIVG